jgi:hypothetical protein
MTDKCKKCQNFTTYDNPSHWKQFGFCEKYGITKHVTDECGSTLAHLKKTDDKWQEFEAKLDKENADRIELNWKEYKAFGLS